MKTVLRFAFALVILAFVAGTHAEDKAKEKWVSLFDGKTMKGWEKVGNKKSVALVFVRPQDSDVQVIVAVLILLLCDDDPVVLLEVHRRDVGFLIEENLWPVSQVDLLRNSVLAP